MFLTYFKTPDMSSLEKGSCQVQLCKSFYLLLTLVLISPSFKAGLSLTLGTNSKEIPIKTLSCSD